MEAFMKNFVYVLGIALLPGLAIGADDLEWAYPATPKPAPLDNVVQKQVPGSARKYTQAQIDDGFNPPDWFPDEHPPMPEIVANGKKPARACALCHLPTGNGHPESSSLAGLPVSYLVRQMAEFKSGNRKGVRAAAPSRSAIASSCCRRIRAGRTAATPTRALSITCRPAASRKARRWSRTAARAGPFNAPSATVHR